MSILQGKRILVIGMGNIAKALIRGLLNDSAISRDNIFAVIHGTSSKKNAQELDIQTVTDVTSFKADIVLLALKPQVMLDVLPLYQPLVCDDTLFISVAAGLAVADLQKALGAKAQIVRAMPNTPSEVGAGMAGLYGLPTLLAQHKGWVEAFFTASGTYIWLEKEEQMHVVTALSGSGPAYFFYFIEALAEAGISLGLSQTDSYKLAIETCKGAGTYASACYPCQTIQELREKVTSSGGTTEAGMTVLEQFNLKVIASQVVEKARNKSVLLSL